MQTEERKEYLRTYYRTNWKRRLTVLLSAKRRGRRRRGDVTVDDLLAQLVAQDSRCFYTGDPLTLDASDRTRTVSLDLIDAKRGFAVGNVCRTTQRIVRAKQKMSYDEFRKMCESVIAHQISKV